LVYFVVIWNIFPRFGILDQKNLATLVWTGIKRRNQYKPNKVNICNSRDSRTGYKHGEICNVVGKQYDFTIDLRIYNYSTGVAVG
jgi:hypothetical protein